MRCIVSSGVLRLKLNTYRHCAIASVSLLERRFTKVSLSTLGPRRTKSEEKRKTIVSDC